MATPAPAGTGAASVSRVAELLGQIIEPSRVLSRPIDLIAFASDASFYRLIPQAVVLSRGIEEIQALFRFSHEHRLPLTFRAAGTSLSGQAISDGLLVECARHWRTLQVEDNGRRVRVGPGIIGNQVNIALRSYGAKMGPDPASINACMMGGILANNSSGMCCGVTQNAYHTLESLTFVLPSGTVIDTAAPDADQQFRAREPKLAEGVLELKRELESNSALRERIRSKYRQKNTTGYSLNAFLDFERPVDIFRHVLIGSEGTLAFVAEAVLNTVPDLPVKYTGLLLFPDVYAACEAIVPLRDAGAKALELMDRASLRSVQGQPGIPPRFAQLSDSAAAILAEFQAASEGERSALEESARIAVAGLKLLETPVFTHDAAEQAALWRIRAGLFPSIGASRKSGTSVIIEDVTFPIDRLAEASLDLNRLFLKHGYDNGIIFGHAKDGNLHFQVTQSFNDQAAIDQYARFMEDVAEIVVTRYDGAMKAEHGTGRNMAPFVEVEWGPDAYRVMKRLKELSDPESLLNPGVIINPDPKAHLHDLKPMPTVEEEVDKCTECGFCEPKCPSRELTTTPRRRIVIRREMTRLENIGERGGELYGALAATFPYDVLDTCAADGMCATACPVSIDTGQLTKRFRCLLHSERAHNLARTIAVRFGLFERFARLGLRAGHMLESLLGVETVAGLTRLLRRVTGAELPLWSADIPHPAGPVPRTRAADAQAIYFPSCVSRTMGFLGDEPRDFSVMEAMIRLAARADVPIHIPDDAAGHCCGVPFSSKGFDEAHKLAVNQTIESFWRWSHEGRLPVVVDTSPCTYGLRSSRSSLTPANQERFDRMRILDSIEFAHDTLLPKLSIRLKADSVALHPVCSVVKLNLTPKLEGIARACSDGVTVPLSAGCCGFAGDRGFLLPELTQSATKQEAAELRGQRYDGYFSSSRTCEIGMTRATGEVYRSFLYMLEMASREEV